MEKSKLGLPIGLFGALLFFIGATGNGVFILSFAAAYIMLFETSEWLKKTIIKALIISIIFSILILSLNYLGLLLPYLSSSVSSWVNADGTHYNGANNIIVSYLPMLTAITRILEIFTFVVLGFGALYKQAKRN